MINLLPSREKERIYMERIKKAVIILWFLVFFFILCLVLVLFSIRVYFKSQALAQEADLLSSQNKAEVERIEKLKKEAQSINFLVSSVGRFYEDKIYFSEITRKISSVLPSGLSLSDLSLQLDSSEKKRNIKVSLSGLSLTRESLINLKDNLEKEGSFADVYMPPSNWIKAANIKFSATFLIDYD